MKLPQLTAGNAPTQLAKSNLGGPAALAQSQAGLAKAVGGLANQIAERGAEHQVLTAESDVKFKMGKWSEENDAVLFYDAEDLRSRGLSEDKIRGRQTVPAYEVRPALYKMESEKVIADNAAMITPGRYRSDFQFNENNKSFQEQADRVVTSSKEQRDQENLEKNSDAERFRQNGMYKEAAAVYRTMDDYPNVINDLVLETEDDAKFAVAERIWTAKDYTSALKELDRLYNSFDEKGNYIADEQRDIGDRALNETRTREAIRLLEGMFDEPKNTTGTKLSKELDDYVATIKYGGQLTRDPDYYVDLQRRTDAEFGSDSEKSRRLREEQEWHIDRRSYVAKSPWLQKRWLKEEKDNLIVQGGISLDADGNVPDGWQNSKAGRAYINHETQVKSNIVRMKSDPGGYYDDMIRDVPMVHPSMSNEQISAAFKEREEMYLWMKQSANSNRKLTDEETNDWVQFFKNASPLEFIEKAGVITQQFGRDASVEFWEELELKAYNPGTTGIIGRLAAKGRINSAYMIMDGNRLRKSDSTYIKNKMDVFIPQIKDKLGSTFKNDKNYKYNAAMQEAIMDTYVFMANRDGLMDGNLDDETLDKAIETVTNGMYDFEGTVIELPQNINAAMFQSRFDITDPDHFNQINGGILGEDGVDFYNKVKSGDYQMRSIGDNKYVFYDMDDTRGLPLSSGTLIMGNELGPDGQPMPYEYSYDPNAPIDGQSYKELQNESPIQRYYRTGTFVRDASNLSAMEQEQEFQAYVKKGYGKRSREDKIEMKKLTEEFNAQMGLFNTDQDRTNSFAVFLGKKRREARNARIKGRKNAAIKRWSDKNAQ